MEVRSLAIAAGVSVLFGFVSSQSYATCKIDITEYAGWKIDLAGIITKYEDHSTPPTRNFNGCKPGRTLIINHSLNVECIGTLLNPKLSIPTDVVLLTDGEKQRACFKDRMADVQYRIPK